MAGDTGDQEFDLARFGVARWRRRNARGIGNRAATGGNQQADERYLDQVKGLSEQNRHKIFEGNARRVYPRLDKQLRKKT